MSRSARLPAVLAAAVAAAEGAVALLAPREAGPDPVAVEPRAYFSDAELARATAFRRGQRRLALATALAEGAVLAAAARRPPPAGPRPPLAGALTAAGLTAATTAATLPLRAAARERARRVGLVTQGWGGWAVDVAKGTAIGAALAGLAGGAFAAAHGRFGAAWWAPAAVAGTGAAAVLTVAAPVVLDPVFNRFTALPEGPLRADVLALARQAGVEVGEVFEMDASRRTTAANAYVTGLGATKRVVLFDTLVRDFTAAEVRLVVAHELAHVRHRDVPRGLLWLALSAPGAALAVARVAGRLERPGRTPVPAAALALAVVGPVLTAVASRLSRAIERRADRTALELTGEPGTLIAFERRITLQNVGDPRPPRWIQRLLATHPDTMERIGAALAFERA